MEVVVLTTNPRQEGQPSSSPLAAPGGRGKDSLARSLTRPLGADLPVEYRHHLSPAGPGRRDRPPHGPRAEVRPQVHRHAGSVGPHSTAEVGGGPKGALYSILRNWRGSMAGATGEQVKSSLYMTRSTNEEEKNNLNDYTAEPRSRLKRICCRAELRKIDVKKREREEDR